MSTDTGGPAFPLDPSSPDAEHGMTLLDWFAGMLAPALVTQVGGAVMAGNTVERPEGCETDADVIARASYAAAAAMIEAKRRYERFGSEHTTATGAH